jgi:hypothetical protein
MLISMTATTMRVSTRTRDTIMAIAREDYGGVTVDEALRRLAREHWQRRAIAAVARYRDDDPAGWSDHLDEMGDLERLDEPVTDSMERS